MPLHTRTYRIKKIGMLGEQRLPGGGGETSRKYTLATYQNGPLLRDEVTLMVPVVHVDKQAKFVNSRQHRERWQTTR